MHRAPLSRPAATLIIASAGILALTLLTRAPAVAEQPTPAPAAAQEPTPAAAATTPAPTTPAAGPAAAPQRAGAQAAVPRGEPTPTAPKPQVARSPLMAEMQGVLDAEKAKVAELAARLRQTTDKREALALQREIEQAKAQTEIQLLRIQATHARRAGRADAAERIEAAIQQLSAPPARGTPVQRPIPETSRTDASRSAATPQR